MYWRQVWLCNYYLPDCKSLNVIRITLVHNWQITLDDSTPKWKHLRSRILHTWYCNRAALWRTVSPSPLLTTQLRTSAATSRLSSGQLTCLRTGWWWGHIGVIKDKNTSIWNWAVCWLTNKECCVDYQDCSFGEKIAWHTMNVKWGVSAFSFAYKI